MNVAVPVAIDSPELRLEGIGHSRVSRMLRPVEVRERTTLSSTHIHRLQEQGRFPPYVRMGARARGVPEHVLDAFLAERMVARAGLPPLGFRPPLPTWRYRADLVPERSGNRRLVRAGRDPLAEKRKIPVPTFRAAAQGFFDTRKDGWSRSHALAWWQSLENHVFDRLGSRKVDGVASADVVDLLHSLRKRHPSTARRMRYRIRCVFDWCLSNGFVQVNVAGDVIKSALPTARPPEEPFKALDHIDIADVYRRIGACDAAPQVRLCLQFIILTAVRNHEAREAVWGEIDFETRTWCIPAARTKTRRDDHRQPLSRAALDVLSQARHFSDGSALIFPSPAKRGCAFGRSALHRILKQLAVEDFMTVHGCRATFRTWADECASADYEHKELSLSHRVGTSVGRRYQRSDLLELRRPLLEAWGDYVTGVSGAPNSSPSGPPSD